MFDESKKKRNIIIIGSLFIVSLLLFIIFINKSNEENKKKDKENNYTITFNHYSNDDKDQTMKFIYKDKKLNKVKVTLYFSNKSDAKFIADELKSNNEYQNVVTNDNTVTLTYKNEDIKEYEYLTKSELQSYMETQGYKIEK